MEAPPTAPKALTLYTLPSLKQPSLPLDQRAPGVTSEFELKQLELPLDLPKIPTPPTQLEFSLNDPIRLRQPESAFPPEDAPAMERQSKPESASVPSPAQGQDEINGPVNSSPSSTSSVSSVVSPQLNELPVEFYGAISGLCKTKVTNRSDHQHQPSERVIFLTRLLRDLNIPFVLDVFQDSFDYPVTPSETKVPPQLQEKSSSFGHSLLTPFTGNKPPPLRQGAYSFGHSGDNQRFFYNIILPGTSNHVVLAHHDICNLHSENANDNSASVINAIAAKRLRPELTVVLSDGEEPPYAGAGARRLARQIHAKVAPFDGVRAVVNLELTGIGGPNFVVGDVGDPCTAHIVKEFGCPRIPTPPSDSTILLSAGIPSAVLVTLPIQSDAQWGRYQYKLSDGRLLDHTIIYRCHSREDSLDKINPLEMKAFVEERLVPIVDSFSKFKTPED